MVSDSKNQFLKSRNQFLESRNQFLESRNQFLESRVRFLESRNRFQEPVCRIFHSCEPKIKIRTIFYSLKQKVSTVFGLSLTLNHGNQKKARFLVFGSKGRSLHKMCTQFWDFWKSRETLDIFKQISGFSQDFIGISTIFRIIFLRNEYYFLSKKVLKYDFCYFGDL